MERFCIAGFVAIVAMGFAGLAGMALSGNAVEIAGQWVNTSPKAEGVHHGYFTVVNRGAKPRRLVTIESPFYGSSGVEAGYATLRQPVVIKPGGRFEFQPSGPFASLSSPIRTLAKGSSIPLVLVFEDGERISVMAPLRVISSGSFSELSAIKQAALNPQTL